MKMLVLIFALGSSLAGAAGATPYSAWNHPRRAEVLQRQRHEQWSNRNAYHNGLITRGQEQRLMQEDRHIYRQEQVEARRNGGYLTAAQQAHLNHEENRVNWQRNQDIQRDRYRRSL
ncbi:hypothetical protein ABS71_16625 [bacterium SCN 62-11]|nr:MAG: hypothetical protein ABS71_16625 [bacterium SCN 62-11]